MTDKQLIRSLRKLARDECANYKEGYCLETDKRCHVISEKFDTVHDGAINCDYFLECVLPANRELNDLVAYALWYDGADLDQGLPRNVKRCPMCGRIFEFTSNRQIYCKACTVKAAKLKRKERRAKNKARK